MELRQKAKIWETARTRAPHWAQAPDLEIGCARFPAYSIAKVMMVKTPDRSLLLRLKELHAPQGKRFRNFASTLGPALTPLAKRLNSMQFKEDKNEPEGTSNDPVSLVSFGSKGEKNQPI